MNEQGVILKELMNNPENLIEVLSQYTQTEAYRAREQTIIYGPHLDPDIIYQCATDPAYKVEKTSIQHISMCPVCREEYILLLQTQGKPFEVQEFDLLEFLKHKISSLKIQIQSFVDRMIEVIEPEPAVQYMGSETPGGESTTQKREPILQGIETDQFVAGEVINFEIIVPADGYVTVFTVPESGPMRLVFPRGEKFDTSVSGQEVKKISFTAPEPPGRWSLKAIWTIDDPLGSLELPVDEFWNDKALQCLAEHIKESDEDEWAAGTFEFEVKKK